MARNQGIHALIRFTGNIRTLCEEGQLVEALQDVELMCQKGVDVSTDIFYCLVQCCVNCKNLAAGRRVHSLIVRSGFEANTFLASHLIRMFTFFESLLDANQVFSQLPSPSAFAWSATISAHAKLRQPEQAIELYKQMKLSRVIPNVYVFLNVLKACSNTAALAQGKVIHAHIIENSVDADIVVRNTLIDMYAKCGSLEDARRVFEKLPNHDVVTWNAMIAGFAYNGCFQDGLCLFKKMQRQGMEPNSVTWNAMIAGYVKHGLGLDALRFFHQMQQEGVQPSKATLISSVQACSSIAAFECGKVIHVQINESSLKSDVVVGSTLIDMYVKCGRLEDARSVFDSLPKADLVTCNVMICGYAQQGEGQLALRFFQQMQQGGMKPDNFTFVSILKACSKIGALEQGKEIHFHVIECGFECDIFIGSTLIDMYSKWHSLEDGHRVFEKLPKRNIVTWNAIIAGYVQCSDYKSVLQHFYNMQHEGVKPDAVTFICLLSVCNHVGLVDEAYDHFKLMKADYGITPTLDHYDCMVDLLGRVGYLNEAVELLKGIPFQVGIMAWRSLLGHCRTHGHVEFGRLCFNEVITMDVKDSAGYVLMSNIYVDSGMWGDSDKLQECRKSAGAQKKAGMAFIEIDSQVHRFLVGERNHPTGEVFGKLKRLSGQMKLTSYVPSLDLVLQSMLDEDEDI